MSGSLKLPDVRFSRRLQIGTSGFRDCQWFSTFAAAIAYLNSLPVGERPAEDRKYLLEVHPGAYPERVNLPDYCWARSIAPVSAFILGDGVAGGYTVSTGVGGLFNMFVLPQAPLQDVGWFLRNTKAVYTVDITGAIVGTLDVTPGALAQETFTFTGEATATAVAATINATGINVEAVVRFNFVEIRTTAADDITVNPTGTANAALGFSALVDTENPRPLFPYRKADDVIVAGAAQQGVLVTDLSASISYFDGLTSVVNGDAGIEIEDGVQVALWQPSITVNGNNGLRMLGTTVSVTVDGGSIIGNTGDDIDDQGGTLIVRATAFDSRTGGASLIPQVHAETIKILNADNLFDGILQPDVETVLNDFAKARVIYLTPSSMFALAGGPTKGVIGTAEAWLFPGVGAARSLYGQLYIPDFKYGPGTMFRLRFNLAHTAVPGVLEKVWFDINVAYIGGTDSLTAPVATDVFTANPLVGGPIVANLRTADVDVDLTFGKIAANDLVLFELKRDPANVNDTYGSDTALLGVELLMGV